MVIRTPPESKWPTGEWPDDSLMAAAAAEGLSPAAVAGATERGIRRGVQQAQAELRNEQLAQERVEYLSEQVRTVPDSSPGTASGPGATMEYSLPLGPGKKAAVYLYGDCGIKELSLLVDYIALTAKAMKENADATADLPEVAGPAAGLPALRRPPGNRER